MPGDGRHFATVLFLDIVGSTQIADELGDADWQRLLARFRSTVRTELKRHGGHEVDTAGDGFFVTFADPLAAIRAADAIATSVQSLGLDVRVGIHAGEVEVADKHVSGMTVHVGARTMALAGPAQTAVTSTVRDMEVGGPVGFEDAGEHELKGVPGTWHLSYVRRINGREVAQPLDPSVVPERRAAVLEDHPRRRAAIVASVLVVLALVTGFLVVRSFGAGSPEHDAVPNRPALVRVDLSSRTIDASIDMPMGESGQLPPGLLGGDLVRVLADHAEFRDPTTGELLDSRPIPSWDLDSIGGGFIWLASRQGSSRQHWLRLDPRTGEVTGRLKARGKACVSACVAQPRDASATTIMFGPGEGWFLTEANDLSRVDPISLDVKAWRIHQTWSDIVPYPRGVWLPDPLNERLWWFDQRTQDIHNVPIPPHQIFIIDGDTPFTPARFWILDPESEVVTPLGDGHLEPAESFGITGLPRELDNPASRVLSGTFLRGVLWVVAWADPQAGMRTDSALIGLPAADPGAAPTTIAMPDGFEGNWPLADPSGEGIWVASCYCTSGSGEG